jgi:hypothetical protein
MISRAISSHRSDVDFATFSGAKWAAAIAA